MALDRTARTLAARLTPGGRAHGLARFAARVARIGRGVAPEVRDELDHVGLRLRGGWNYQRWAARQVLGDTELDELERWASSAPTATAITVLLVGAGDGADEVLGETRQCWSASRVHHVESMEGAAAWLAESEPVDPHEWVVVLDDTDRLLAGALARLAAVVVANPLLDAVSFDDELNDPGAEPPARFRPVWSPDTSLSFDLWERSVMFRRRAAMEAGGLDADLGDQAWWDLWLRLGSGRHRHDGRTGTEIWGQLPAVCVRRGRRHPTVGPRGVTVVAAELSRRGWDATPQIDHRDSVEVVDLHWRLNDRPAPPTVAVVVPTRHNVAFLDGVVADVAAASYRHVALVVVDNGERTDESEADYERWSRQLDGRLDVVWWSEPFNYSAVNNAAARRPAAASADVLVFLNDDCRCPVRGWLEPLVGWATADGVVVAGAQLLDRDGSIQHGGVAMGLNGLAEHLFAGTRPDRDTLIGPTDATRNVSAVTGAALAIRRTVFEAVGGFDESFRLVGGDVALCTDAVSVVGNSTDAVSVVGNSTDAVSVVGNSTRVLPRVVVTATAPIRHLESATRGDYEVDDDAFRSWWRFQRPVRGGDPHLHPALSRVRHEPTPRSPLDPDPLDLLGAHFGRELHAGTQSLSADRAAQLAVTCDVPPGTRQRVAERHARHAGPIELRDLTLFLPDFDSPFYGGVNTALRIAAVLCRRRDVHVRVVMISAPHDAFFRTAIEAAYPELSPLELTFLDGPADPRLAELPPTDLALATIWHSAYAVARYGAATRSAYLVQDFEPCFVPAGSEFALAEETYCLGLVGLCNTDTMADMFGRQYGGAAVGFTPQVDGRIFHAAGRRNPTAEEPVTVFLYARPGHWRNCWEIAAPALRQVKERFGDRVRLVTAGSWTRPAELDRSIEHLGLVDYRDTGALYRSADVGLALTVSRHPSYLPLELMACGVPTVGFDLGDDAAWLLRHDDNCLLAPRTVSGVSDALARLVDDGELRNRLRARGLADIAARHSDWEGEILRAVDDLTGPLDRLRATDSGSVRSWRLNC